MASRVPIGCISVAIVDVTPGAIREKFLNGRLRFVHDPGPLGSRFWGESRTESLTEERKIGAGIGQGAMQCDGSDPEDTKRSKEAAHDGRCYAERGSQTTMSPAGQTNVPPTLDSSTPRTGPVAIVATTANNVASAFMDRALLSPTDCPAKCIPRAEMSDRASTPRSREKSNGAQTTLAYGSRRAGRPPPVRRPNTSG